MKRHEFIFLGAVYLLGLYLRLGPRLEIDPHQLTFQGDIWYRLCMAQAILDNHTLPDPDIRYLAYGCVPMWYPPLSPMLFAFGSYITSFDIATFSSRVVPFFEAATPLSLYPLARYLYSERVAVVSTTVLAMTPSFVFWSGISDPQSFTLFIIPLLVAGWIWHSKQKQDNMRLLAFGVVLGVNFLMHLSYFITLIILLTTTLALVINREAKRVLFLDLLKIILVSQVITALWWLPKNLYWWWINALVTSSGMYGAVRHLSEYGIVTASLGILAFLYISHGYLLRHRLRHLILILWAIPLFIETQNESIIGLLSKVDPGLYNTLEWSTLGKPLEG
ncbi:glycosyltransferase family 39 protein, partial [archaeon]|nr:glycosyltransferase family 39 protein [archaeon]